jgi:hypothetical protein
VTACGRDGSQVALESLAAALDPREFAVIMVTETGRPPCLTVVNRHTLIAEDIYADHWAYWWRWVQLIAATADPLAAAHRVTVALSPVSGARQ